MILTLYKNCIVKDSYAEVFSPSVFEEYLSGLDSDIINLDASYPTLRGRIQLDYTGLDSPFEYNYLKIEEGTQVYYCFINSIDLIADNLASLSYVVDVWHTYIGKTKQRNSILDRSKILPEDTFGFLPLDYQTDSPIYYDDISLNDGALAGKVGLLVEFQIYKTVSTGTEEEPQTSDQRQSFLAYITVKERSLTDGSLFDPSDTPATAAYSIPEVEEMIQGFIRSSSFKTLAALTPDKDTNTNLLGITGSYNYEIVNMYILPAEWCQAIAEQYTMSKTFSTTFVEWEDKSGSFIWNLPFIKTKQVQLWLFLDVEIVVGETGEDPEFVKTYAKPDWRNFLIKTLDNNYKNISVGAFTNPIPLSNNGREKVINLKVSIDAFNLNLMLIMDGRNYDITQFYSLEVPFTAINAETAQLRKIADREKRENAKAKIIGSSMNFLGQQLSTWTGASIGSPQDVTFGKIGSTISGIGTTGQSIATAVNAIQAADAAKYQLTYGQEIDIVGPINAYYGLVIFRMTNTYNTREVTYAINNLGYETSIPVTWEKDPWNPLNLDSTTAYNPTRYAYINLYGAAPQNIIQQLENILTSGTKIFYNTTLI